MARGKETAINPAVFNAAALAIIAAGEDGKLGVPGYKPDVKKGEEAKAKVTAAMQALRAVAPNAGAYVNEADYFQADWQRQFWGENYQRLLTIKRRYDPTGVFSCHHCVGSEDRP